MKKPEDALAHMRAQFRRWTVIGPFVAPPGIDDCADTPLDGLTRIPASPMLGGKRLAVRRIRANRGVLDFSRLAGVALDKSQAGRPKQIIAMAALDCPWDCALTLRFDADWYTIWWVDGKEVYNTKQGNAGDVGTVRYKIVVSLRKGRHTVAVRVIGTKLLYEVEAWQRGVADEHRTDRGAAWRDYTRRMVRLEHRPSPDRVQPHMTAADFERRMSEEGVEARWLSVVNQHEGAYYRSRHIPACSSAKPEYEQQLKDWVAEIHKNRMAAMSWYGLIFCRPLWERHPDWRQQFLVPNPRPTELAKYACCINSPYGDRVIAFTIEALKKFDLDGFWYDGCFFSPYWTWPRTVSCVCAHCRRKFKRETGLDLPARYDWSLPEFRRWVQWRYEMYSAYWQRLTDEVHAAVPEATIVFNHYHREGVGWNAAIPLNPFGRHFLSGSEADGEPLRGAFYTRALRAYDREQTEVWTSTGDAIKAMANGKDRVLNPRGVTEFAVACATAGGHCSLGGYRDGMTSLFFRDVAREIKARGPYLNLPTLPFAALHVSQQTETFVFGRDPDFVTDKFTDYYWNSLTGWHHALSFARLSPDVLFDAHLTAEKLSRYRLLVTPLASALTPAQSRALMDYARRGGVLVTGPWFGLFDEWGEPARGYPLGDRSIFRFGGRFPSWQEIHDRPELDFASFRARPLHAIASPSDPVRLSLSRSNAAVSLTRLGRGMIVQTAFDIGTLFRYSRKEAVVRMLREFLRGIGRPSPVEIIGDDRFIFGVFGQGKKTTVIHVQRFNPPWKPEEITVTQPGMTWSARMLWRGPKPVSVHCALPEPSPELPVRRAAEGWAVALPPFRCGQVVIVRS